MLRNFYIAVILSIIIVSPAYSNDTARPKFHEITPGDIGGAVWGCDTHEHMTQIAEALIVDVDTGNEMLAGFSKQRWCIGFVTPLPMVFKSKHGEVFQLSNGQWRQMWSVSTPIGLLFILMDPTRGHKSPPPDIKKKLFGPTA